MQPVRLTEYILIKSTNQFKKCIFSKRYQSHQSLLSKASQIQWLFCGGQDEL